jgi:hypothetical protein
MEKKKYKKKIGLGLSQPRKYFIHTMGDVPRKCFHACYNRHCHLLDFYNVDYRYNSRVVTFTLAAVYRMINFSANIWRIIT